MAERRMFAKRIIDSDAFLDMSITAQALYFHLAMRADDDGFIDNPKKIMRMVGCQEDDLRILIGRKFILAFETGVIVVRHWKIHNYIQRDRYHETVYQEEYKALSVKNSGEYVKNQECIQIVSNMDTDCIQPVSNLCPQVRLGKSKDIDSINTSCSEPSFGSSEPAAESDPIPEKEKKRKDPKPKEPEEPAVITLILNDGSDYGVGQKAVDEFQEIYPGVDIMKELRAMKGWLLSNPTRRKTKSGITRFINSWLAREQNRTPAGTYQQKAQKGGGNEANGYDVSFYGYSDEY